MGWLDSLFSNGTNPGGYEVSNTGVPLSGQSGSNGIAQAEGGMGGMVGQAAKYLTGGYDPQAMLMKKLGVSDSIPGWVKGANALKSMGPIGFSNGRSWFGMQQGRDTSGQAALMAALLNEGKPAETKNTDTLVLKNESTTTPMDPQVRIARPMRYNDSVGPWERDMRGFHPMSNLGSTL